MQDILDQTKSKQIIKHRGHRRGGTHTSTSRVKHTETNKNTGSKQVTRPPLSQGDAYILIMCLFGR